MTLRDPLAPEGFVEVDRSQEVKPNTIDPLNPAALSPAENWVEVKRQPTNTYVPSALRGTRFAPAIDEVDKFLMGRGDQGFEMAVRLNRGDLAWALETFKGVSPDTAAKVQKLARERNASFGSMLALAGTRMDEWDQWQEAGKILNSLFETSEVDGRQTLKYPYTANWIAQPENMAMAKDDIDALTELEALAMERYKSHQSLFANAVYAANSMMNSFASGLVKAPAVVYTIIAESWNRNVADFLEVPHLLLPPVADALVNNPVTRVYDRAAEYFAPAKMEGDVVEYVRKGDYKGAALNLYNGITGNTPQNALFLLTALAGAPAAGLWLMGLSQAGSTFAQDLEEGKTPAMASLDAMMQGGLEALWENAGTLAFLKMAEKRLAASIGKVSTKQLIKEFFVLAGKGAIQEGPYEEGLTTLTQTMSDWLTGDDQAFDGFMGQLVNSMLIGGFSGMGMTAPAAIAHAVQKSEVLKTDVKWWDKFSGVAAVSKLRERSGEDFTDFVEKVTKGMTFFLRTEALSEFFQGDEEQVRQVAKELGIEDQLNVSLQSDAELEIPVSKWMTKYAGSELSAHIHDKIRFQPNGLTIKELRAVKDDLLRIISANRNELTELTDGDVLPDQLELMRNQLMAPRSEGGMGMAAEDADASVRLWIAGSRFVGNETGESIQDVINRLNPTLQIGGEYQGEGLTQEDPLITEAKKYPDVESFLNFMRGSATQYRDYNPSLRATVGVFEDSARISDLGIDPEQEVTIYRGVPDAKTQQIQDGDFVTVDKLSAESYAGKDNVVSKKVKAKDLIVDSASEFDAKNPFALGAEFVYSDAKNTLTTYTDQQLTDIWNKAQQQKVLTVEEVDQLIQNAVFAPDHYVPTAAEIIDMVDATFKDTVSRPEAEYLIGPTASGKTSISSRIVERLELPIVDPDNYKAMFKGYTPERAPLYHEASSVANRAAMIKAIREKLPFLNVVTGRNTTKYQTLVASLKNSGRPVNAYYIHVELSESLRRNELRKVTKRGMTIPEEAIKDNHSGGLKTAFEVFIPDAAEFTIYENPYSSTGKAQTLPVAKFKNGKLVELKNEEQLGKMLKEWYTLNGEEVTDEQAKEIIFALGRVKGDDPGAVRRVLYQASTRGAFQEAQQKAAEIAKVLPPPTYFQMQNIPDWKEKTTAWMKENGYTKQEIAKHIAAIDGQLKVLSFIGPLELELLPRGANLNPAPGKGLRTGQGGPIRTNADFIYKISFDASAMCPKRLEVAATTSYIQSKLGRALTTSERVALVALFKSAGKTAPCLYCYVEAPRAKMAEFVRNASSIVFGSSAVPASWSASMKAAAKAAQKEAKQQNLKDIDANVLTDPEYAVTEEAQGLVKQSPAVYSFLKKAALAAKANLPKLYEEYNGQILDLQDSLIEELNGYAGLRFFSSSDFQIEHFVDLLQAFNDMVLKGAKAHSYTKVPAFVEIFGNTGMKIQTSVFAKEVNGKIVMDDWQGMDWTTAKKFRKKYADVGTVLVATSDAIIEWGLDQEWIDYIIPFHYSGLEKKFYGTMGWQDYTTVQSEKSLTKGKSPQKIRMWELDLDKGVDDKTATKRYLKLVAERGLEPVFPKFKDHPNYIKLKKDYARTDTPFRKVTANIDMKKAAALLKQYFEDGGSNSVADTVLGDELVQQIKDYAKTGKDIGVEALKQINGKTYAQGPKGSVSFTNTQTILRLFKSADFSTLLHETAHVFTEEMRKIIESGMGSDQLKADYQTLLDFADGKLDRAGHEKIAKSFEAYLREGKAPSLKLVEAFRRFRNWLTSIYKSIVGYAEINNDVRGVFDRMLASDREIKEAEAYYKAKQSLVELIPATEKQRANVAKKKAKAHETALERQTTRYLNKYLEMVGGRSAIREDAAKEIDSKPVYKAIAKLKEKALNTNDIVKDYGKDAVNILRALHGPIVKRNGTYSLSELAAEFDFSSPEALLDAMEKAENRQQAITARTNEIIDTRAEEIRADLANQEANPGDEALHNDASLAFLIAEAEVIASALERQQNARPQKLEERVYKDAAEEIIRQKKVRHAASYATFAKAEQRAANQAYDAAEAGDMQTAFDAKKKQILNHALVQAAIKARDEKAAFEKRYGAKNLDTRLAKVENAFASAALDLIKTYGLSTGKNSKPQSTGVKLDLREIDPVLADLTPEWIQNKEKPEGYKTWRDLTVQQLRDLDNVLKALINYGKDELLSIQNAQYKTVTDLQAASIERGNQLKDRIKIKGVAAEKYEEFSVAGNLLNAMDGLISRLKMIEFIAERLDGYQVTKTKTFGPFRLLFNRGIQAEADKYQIKKQIFESAQTHWDTLYKAQKRIEAMYGHKAFDIRGVPVHPDMYRLGRTRWTVERMLAIVLNMGNEHNLEVLKKAYEFTDEQLNTIAAHFNAAELEAIQGIWDVTDSMYPLLDAVHFRMYNRHLDKVAASKVTIRNANGETTLRGGYYPLMFDHTLSDIMAKRQEKQAAEDDILRNRQMAVLRSTKPADGMTYSRKPGHSLPPDLRLGVWFTHIEDTARYISFAEYMRDLNMFTLGSDWRDMVRLKAGRDAYNAIRSWAVSQALPNQSQAVDLWDEALDWQRRTATTAILGANIGVGFKQRLSMINAAEEIGWNYIIQGFKDTDGRNSILGLSNSETWKKMLKLSPYLEARMKAYDREVRDTIDRVKPMVKRFEIAGHEFTWKDVQEFMFQLILMNDRATVGVVWSGAFNKYIDTQYNEDASEEENTKAAALYADAIVRTTQPSALQIDLSGIQRQEGMMRLFTSFMTWMLKYGNRLMAKNQALRDGVITPKQYIRHVAFEVFLPAWGAMMIGMVFGGGDRPDWWDWMLAPLESLISWIPILRDVVAYYKYDKDLGSSPSFEGANRVLKAGSTAVKTLTGDKEWMDLLWDIGRAVEVQTGVAPLNVVKSINNIYLNATGQR